MALAAFSFSALSTLGGDIGSSVKRIVLEEEGGQP